MLAIIGGTGLTRLSSLAVAHREVVRTPYGEPSAALIFGQLDGSDAVFLARHGHGHTIPPHRVNYRANLWALKHRGATSVAVSGPRLETAAEIDRMERDGATMVGMTGMPEAALARELPLPYAAVCVVVNHAAGRGDSARQISMERIAAVLETAMDRVHILLKHVAPLNTQDSHR